MEEPDFDLYEVLHLDRHATRQDVRAAFLDFARIHHPDKVGAAGVSHALLGETPLAGENEAFLRGQDAYRVLSDDALRNTSRTQPLLKNSALQAKRLFEY
eukprot:4364571-Amphidinium_carterae.1